MILWSCGLVRLRDKKPPLYLHYQSPMTIELGRMATSFNINQPKMSHQPMRRWSCEITWQLHYISTIRVHMVTKFGRMVIYLAGLLPVKSNDPLITWLSWSREKLKSLYHQQYGAYGLKSWQDDNLLWWTHAYKFTQLFD